MCQITIEEKIIFEFPDGWQAVQYDKTAFHKDHFSNFAASKCVDIVAFHPSSKTLWLIEVTDYRLYKGEKPKGVSKIDVVGETRQKVRDTLANLYVARIKPEIGIYDFARRAARKTQIRVVLHLEQLAKPSRLHPRVGDWDNMYRSLEASFRVVDPHPMLCNMSEMPPQLPWRVFPATAQPRQ